MHLCITDLIVIQVLFCSIENGRTSFVRQLEPDWHIDTNPEIVFQLAVLLVSFDCQHEHPIKFLVFLLLVLGNLQV